MRISREEETKLVARARFSEMSWLCCSQNLCVTKHTGEYCAKAIGDADEAEDIMQETMVRAFTRLETFRGDSRFSSWFFYMVCSNCIRMHLRTKRRKGALSSGRPYSRVRKFSESETPRYSQTRRAREPNFSMRLVQQCRNYRRSMAVSLFYGFMAWI